MLFEMKKINVLSLFDGMSCGQIALNRAGIKYNKYFASEIKENAIKVTQHNYPDTIQLGDVRDVKASDLPKIDLLIGGSPCQDLSQANKSRTGLDGLKSGLFFEYYRLFKELSPTYFLLENVSMSDKDYMLISDMMGTEPIRINSELVSAQLRDRSYWTNIGGGYYDLFGNRKCGIPLPKDKNIRLQDILECGFTDRQKSRAVLESESRPLRTPVKMFHRYYSTGFTTLVFKDQETYSKMVEMYNNGKHRDPIFHPDNLRYLNQTELEKLQTVPTGYTGILKRDEAASLLGDGWTIDVIAHIFSYINE